LSEEDRTGDSRYHFRHPLRQLLQRMTKKRADPGEARPAERHERA
jgi:hypothetical protein